MTWKGGVYSLSNRGGVALCDLSGLLSDLTHFASITSRGEVLGTPWLPPGTVKEVASGGTAYSVLQTYFMWKELECTRTD